MAYISRSKYEEAFQGVTLLATPMEITQIGSDTPSGFRWIQTVITNVPLGDDPPEKVDQGASPIPRVDPFYNPTPISVFKDDFEDICHRDLPDPGVTLVWRATLSLCGVDLNKKFLVIHDTLYWGFDMVRSPSSPKQANVTVVDPPVPATAAAITKHKAIVTQKYTTWQFSPTQFVRKPSYF